MECSHHTQEREQSDSGIGMFVCKLGKELGKGGFGAVYAATCRQLPGKALAVKQQVIKLSSGVSHLRLRLAWYVLVFFVCYRPIKLIKTCVLCTTGSLMN
jgi:hypothetical protein